MKIRKEYGTQNRVGCTIVRLRQARGMSQGELMAQLQIRNIDIGQTSLSRLEGQERAAGDKELWALSEIFQVPIEELYNKEEKRTAD